MRAAGQRLATMASIVRLPGSTSMVSEVTPRAWAAVISTFISAEATPRPCQASATTTPTSAVRVPCGPAWSAAMACPMITPSRTATTASLWPSPPDILRSSSGPGVTGAKNLRYRLCGDSPAKKSLSAPTSAAHAGRIAGGDRWPGASYLSSNHELSMSRIAESVK